MDQAKAYNGWSNYETWNVALWMGNEEGPSNYWQDRAQEAWNEADPGDYETRDQAAAIALADKLKEHHEEARDEILHATKLQSSMWADLLGAALSEVNWYEIAESYISDVDKEAEADA